LFYGDNLDILKRVPDESIDLIYLDPPFNSKADYNVLFKEVSGEKSTAQKQAFSDFWEWDSATTRTYAYLTGNEVNNRVATVAESLHQILGQSDMTAYLFMMTIRLTELHRVLKPTGSLWLHCDSTASHYLKVVLDAVFGVENFRNEIIWKRFNFHADARRFGKVGDRILFYSKTKDYKFNRQWAPLKESYKASHFTHSDERGKFTLDNLNPPAGRGPVYEFHGVKRAWRYTREKMLQLEKDGRIYTDSTIPRLKRYLEEIEAKGGAAVHEIWDDIPAVNSQAKERLGFQTQKPEALLERIIKAGSDKGDWVLDPFCGCGTAIEVSEKLNRHWVGIDITFLALNIITDRMRHSFPRARFDTMGDPKDLESARDLAKKDNGYPLQEWALMKIQARPIGSSSDPDHVKRGADKGVDGWMRFADGDGNIHKIVIQVKGGHVGVSKIRELRDTVTRQNASMGIFITLEEPTSEMIKEVKATDPFMHPTWQHEYPRLQILTVQDLLDGKMPDTPPTISSFKEAPIARRASRERNGTLF